MNTFSRLIGRILPVFLVLAMASCKDDDPVIGDGDGFPVADGVYVVAEGADPATSGRLVSEIVEADGFGSQAREGYFANYVYLTAGSYQIMNVVDRKAQATYGGAASVITETTFNNSDCDLSAFIAASNLTDGGAAIAIANAGLYKVMYDVTLKEAVFHKIEKAQVIGAATPAGWGHSDDMIMNVVGTASGDGVKFEKAGVVLRPGQYKVRFNCRWGIDRRIDPEAGFAAANGYVAFTNFGGTFSQLVPGGANFEAATGEDGVYTIVAEWKPATGFVLSSTKTSSLEPIAFDPEAYAWGIIGAGGPTGNWDNDQDLNYEGLQNGAYTWVGTFDVNGEFKFRTNDSWTFNIGYNDVTRTGDVAGITDVGGNFNATGNYTFRITTTDEGTSWTVNFTLN